MKSKPLCHAFTDYAGLVNRKGKCKPKQEPIVIKAHHSGPLIE
jgi:hypothetical protein